MRSDPPTGDELTTLLVSVKTSILTGVDGVSQEAGPVQTPSPRRIRPKIVGIVVAVVILLGLGTAGGAVALGLLPDPFQAPAPAPSTTSAAAPSPESTAPAVPTRTPAVPTPVDYSPPVPSVPLDCSALAAGLPFAPIIPSLASGSTPLVDPSDAALAQAGVLSCFWYSDDPSRFSLLSLDVVADAPGGLAEIGERLASGASALGVGDASSITCDVVASGCQVSLVAGDYWIELAQQGTVDASDPMPVLAAFAQSLTAAIEGLPSNPSWQTPPTSWSPVGDCSAIAPDAAVGDIVGNPALIGPTDEVKGAQNGIDFSLSNVYTCWWSTPEGVASSPDRPAYIGVQLAPGARWAFDSVVAEALAGGGEAVTVAGAENAVQWCRSAEGTWCTLDVLTEDSWLQVSYSPDPGSSYSSPLAAVAEAILAAHHQR